MDEENEAGGEGSLEAILGQAAAHGAAAQARLAAQGARGTAAQGGGDREQDAAEAGAMRQRLPASFGDSDQQGATGIVVRHALATSTAQAREDEDAQRLTAFKENVYRGVARGWTDLRDQVRTRAVPVEQGIRKLADEHRWLLGESRERWQDAKDLHDRQQDAAGR